MRDVEEEERKRSSGSSDDDDEDDEGDDEGFELSPSEVFLLVLVFLFICSPFFIALCCCFNRILSVIMWSITIIVFLFTSMIGKTSCDAYMEEMDPSLQTDPNRDYFVPWTIGVGVGVGFLFAILVHSILRCCCCRGGRGKEKEHQS